MRRARTGLLIILIGLIIISLAGCKTAQVYPPIQVYVSPVVVKTPLATSSAPTPTRSHAAARDNPRCGGVSAE